MLWVAVLLGLQFQTKNIILTELVEHYFKYSVIKKLATYLYHKLLVFCNLLTADKSFELERDKKPYNYTSAFMKTEKSWRIYSILHVYYLSHSSSLSPSFNSQVFSIRILKTQMQKNCTYMSMLISVSLAKIITESFVLMNSVRKSFSICQQSIPC